MLNMLRKSSGSPLEGPQVWRTWLRSTRNWIIGIVVVLALIDLVGTPHVRWVYVYYGTSNHRTYVRATYLGVTGVRHIEANQVGKGCPLVLFLKSEVPLWKHGVEAVGRFVEGPKL